MIQLRLKSLCLKSYITVLFFCVIYTCPWGWPSAPRNTSIPDLGQQSNYVSFTLFHQEMMNPHESATCIRLMARCKGHAAGLEAIKCLRLRRLSWWKNHHFTGQKGEQNLQLLDLSIKRSFDITQTSSQLCIYIDRCGGIDISLFW